MICGIVKMTVIWFQEHRRRQVQSAAAARASLGPSFLLAVMGVVRT